MSLNLQKSAGTTSATGKENVRELLHVIKSGGDKKGNIFVSRYLTFWEVYSNILGSVHGFIG